MKLNHKCFQDLVNKQQMASISELQEILKEVNQAEGKWLQMEERVRINE